MEAQCNFCSSCLTEDSGGSWWNTGTSPHGVFCQMCWERESSKAYLEQFNKIAEMLGCK